MPGIMKGKRKPDYGRLVDLLTRAAIKEMIIPSLLPVLSPIILYFVILQIGGLESALSSLGRNVTWSYYYRFICCCINDCWGGAWDNAKIYRRWKFLRQRLRGT